MAGIVLCTWPSQVLCLFLIESSDMCNWAFTSLSASGMVLRAQQ